MKLELRRASEGTHFVVCICGERTRKQIVVPLSQALSERIEQMVRAEGIRTEAMILPPGTGMG